MIRSAGPGAAPPTLREVAGAALVVCAVTLVLLWRVFLLGEALVPADLVFIDPVFQEHAPEGFLRPQNPILPDQIRLFYPQQVFVARELRAGGEIPIWNPYAFAGQPLIGNAQSAVFFPPNLLLRWIAPDVLAGWRAAFLLLAGGFFAYLYARRVGVSHAGGCITAVAFVLGGPFIVWLGFPLANVLAWLPFLLWTGEGLLGGERPGLWALLTAAGVGLTIVGGHPETTFHVVGILSLYFLIRVWPALATRWGWRRLLVCVAAIVLGTVLGAVQLLPFVENLLASSTIAARGGLLRGTSLYSATWLGNTTSAITLLYPTFFGTPTAWNYKLPFKGLYNYNEQTLYFGALALALAVAGVVDRRRTPIARLLGLLALVCLLVAWHWPGAEIVNHLPIFSVVNNDRLRLPFAFFGAVLAGFGFDALRRGASLGERDQRRVRRAITAVLVVTLLVPPLALVAGYAPPSWLSPVLVRRLEHLRTRVFVPSELQSWVPFAIALAGLALLRLTRGGKQRLLAVVTIALVAIELLVLAWGYNPAVPRSIIFPRTDVTDRLMAGVPPVRVIATGAFWSNYGTPFGIAQVEAYDLPVPERITALYRSQGGRRKEQDQRWSPEWPIVDLLGVDYVITTQRIRQSGLVPIYSRFPIWLYKNRAALPRARLVHTAEVHPGPEGLTRLVDPSFDFATTVILDDALPAAQAALLRQPSADEAPADVQIASYRPNRVDVRVRTAAAGLLVLSDMMANGWYAKVDGESTPIHRANYAFRAVFVPQGEHEVVFTYEPTSYWLGLRLSLGALLILGAGFAIVIRR